MENGGGGSRSHTASVILRFSVALLFVVFRRRFHYLGSFVGFI